MNIMQPEPIPNNGYRIELADGQRWKMIATESTISWLEKFASIMQLETFEGKGHFRMVFLQGKARRLGGTEPAARLDPSILNGLPMDEWKAKDLEAVVVWSHQDVPDVICEIGDGGDRSADVVRMCLSLYPIYERAQNTGGLPFHAALVKRNGVGILLAARGDGGKSTCCRRLPATWKVLCDDESLIVRVDKNRYMVHPFPTWSDYLWEEAEKTWNVQYYLPLSAIFFLEKAGVDEVIPIGEGEAATYINRSATEASSRNWRTLDRPERLSLRKTLFQNACELARTIPTYKLRVGLSGRFWEEIEKVLF
jgi:SynChlorMet cassette protein ScmC